MKVQSMIAAFVMAVSPVIEAWQGQTPQTYKGAPLPNDPADCVVQLAEKLWGPMLSRRGSRHRPVLFPRSASATPKNSSGGWPPLFLVGGRWSAVSGRAPQSPSSEWSITRKRGSRRIGLYCL